MTREKEIEILMEDGCTREDAKRHLEVGTIVYEDFEEVLRKMIETKEPFPDWGIVELNGKTYYIMYCL